MYSCSMVGCKMQQTKRVWLESGSPIKMGGNNENPSEIGSVELNKKRKLQEEHLGLPSPKHKFRDRLCDSEDEHSINIDKKFGDRHKWPEEHKPYVGASCSLEQCESVNDSNSFVEESDTAMTVDVRAEPKIENGINYYHQTSITSGIGSINDYGNNFFSPSSLTINNEAQSTGMSNESNCGNLENDPHLEQGFLSSDHHHELGMNYTDVMCPEYGNDDEEQPLDVAAEEMTLYSNGVPPNSYILSSGRWSVNPDARLAARRPTIDQEFEQYFSMLML